MDSNTSILNEITNTPKTFAASLSEKILTENIKIDNPKSILDYGMKILRVVLIIYIIAYIILTILNYFKMLPEWLERLFEPFDIISSIKKFRKNNSEKDNEKDKNIESTNQKLATQIEADEEIEPSQYIPQTDNNEINIIPEPDNSSSSTQSSKIANKAGYCYIGEDRGFRSCIKIDEGDNCMSGNIFPSEALCINPNLRT